MISRISSLSKERVRVEVLAIGVSTAVLNEFEIEFAFPLQSIDPIEDDWNFGHWSDPPNSPVADIQVGLDSDSGVEFISGNFYDVWIRVHENTSDGDLPCLMVGSIKVD